MVKIEGESNIIEIGRLLLKKFKGKWVDDNTINFKEGSVSLNNFEMTTKGEKITKYVNELLKKIEDAKKNEITPEKVKQSIFKDILSQIGEYGGLESNPTLFWKLDKEFKKIGIKSLNNGVPINNSNTLKNNIELVINPNVDGPNSYTPNRGYYTRLKDFLFEKLNVKDFSKENFTCSTDSKMFSPLAKEKVIDIKFLEMLIGHYFCERNLILIYFNPFSTNIITPLKNEFPEGVKMVLTVLKSLKLKKVDVENLKIKLLTNTFLTSSDIRIKHLKEENRNHRSSISDYEREICSRLISLGSNEKEVEHLQKMIGLKSEGLICEINKVKRLPFIKKVNITQSEIELTFIPSTISVNNFIRHDHGKSYGKRTFFLGELKITFSPSQFSAYNPDLVNEFPHPHANGQNGSLCFGRGEGRNKIYNMLASTKIEELAKLLWFWVKTYRNEGAYIKMWDFYDSRLQNGYPIWDEKGKRIEINDPERIENGEQRRTIKSSSYEKNLKRFKDLSIF